MSSENNVLKVNIYGTEYTLRSLGDANRMKKVAEYVDAKMREIDQNVRVDSSLKIAILASLNIADELLQEQVDHKNSQTQVKDTIEKLTILIDQKLTDSSD